MATYAFLTGKTPLLSLAEICAVLPQARLLEFSGEAGLIECEKIEKVAGLQNRLGGTIKIAQIIAECGFSKIPAICAELIAKNNQENFLEGKISFAINDYSGKKLPLKQILLETKKKLKSQKISSRFVNKNFANVVGAATIGEKLIEKGIELNLFSGMGKFLAGKTLSIQDIDWYSQRDYDRPARDPKSGMLPPKVAQMMINLAVSPGACLSGRQADLPLILDPFCGSGTILMEAALMGLNFSGSDISEKAVADSRKNLAWLEEKMLEKQKKNFASENLSLHTEKSEKNLEKFPPAQSIPQNLEKSHIQPNNIFIQDVLKNFDQKSAGALFKNQKNISIVAEPYLGPALFSAPSEARIPFIQRELEDLLLTFFKNIHQQLPEIKTIVIIFPYIKTKTRRHFLKILKAVENIGYKPVELLTGEFQKKLSMEHTSRSSLLYERPDQIIGREIFKFQRT